QKQVKEYLADPEIIKLGTRHKEAIFTTKEMLALERDLLGMAKRGRYAEWTKVSEAVLISVNDKRPTMKAEQREALRHITQKTGTVACVTGMAGTGKTFMLEATREALEASGYRVIGAALSGKAAEGLQTGSKIQSFTTARILRDLDNPGFSLIGHKK